MKSRWVRGGSRAAAHLDLGAAAPVALLLLLLTCSGCAPGGAPRPEPTANAPQGVAKVDDLLVVDCLLPGQIRRLGGQVTYVTARRALKTSARDCEIRGGEYVAFDRANYATALKVWLPLAKQGDTAAQTYVGEIFEKGLGVPPDHAAAAEWYRRAADGGSSRAAINLGALYEQGHGVSKDPTQALNWYRRAAGLSDLSFEVTSPGAAADETPQLRKEIVDLRRQLQAKQADLERTQRELEILRQSLDQRRSEVDTERTALARLREELEKQRATTQGPGAARIRDLEKSIVEREAQLAAKDREVADLRAQFARLQSDSAAQRTQVDRLSQQSVDTGPEIQLIEPEVIATRDIQPTRVEASTDRVVVATTDRVAIIGRVLALGGLVSLTVNGHEQKVDSSNIFKTHVAVKKPQERVRIVAVDRGGRKATLEFVVVDRTQQVAVPSGSSASAVGIPLPKQRVAFGNYYALVIGINDYRFLRPLRTAVNDAKEVARVLEKEYGFRVTLLLNPTRYDILSKLNDLRERLTDKDNLLIYYGGHGELDQRNQRGHWLPIDAEPNSSANWISNIAVTDILNAMTVQQLLVVADSCYAGTLTRSALGRLEGGMSEQERIRLMQVMAQKRSRMVMTSGGVEPVIDSAGGPHSVFAVSFIALLGSNAGVLAGQEMFQFLRLRVTATAERVDMRQVPEYAPIKFAGHESGDFFFVRLAN
jgi:caspase domain-containing protein/Sel1 repeat-containing protein